MDRNGDQIDQNHSGGCWPETNWQRFAMVGKPNVCQFQGRRQHYQSGTGQTGAAIRDKIGERYEQRISAVNAITEE